MREGESKRGCVRGRERARKGEKEGVCERERERDWIQGCTPI